MYIKWLDTCTGKLYLVFIIQILIEIQFSLHVKCHFFSKYIQYLFWALCGYIMMSNIHCRVITCIPIKTRSKLIQNIQRYWKCGLIMMTEGRQQLMNKCESNNSPTASPRYTNVTSSYRVTNYIHHHIGSQIIYIIIEILIRNEICFIQVLIIIISCETDIIAVIFSSTRPRQPYVSWTLIWNFLQRLITSIVMLVLNL